jgi:hypothetical protein
MECYLVIKNEIMSFVGKGMELVIIMLSETSQAQKDKISPWSQSYVESRAKKINQNNMT